MGNNGSTSKGRIDVLLERERELRQKIEAERARMARRKARNDHKLFLLVGGLAVQSAAKSPSFQLALKETLQIAVTDERERQLLTQNGLL